MRLAPQTPQQALRLVAAVLTVVVVLLLGSSRPAAQPRPTYEHYVSLGDSYTAAPFVPLTDVAHGCYRSSNNYPHLVAETLRIDDLQDRSCSGAQTRDLTGRQLTVLRMRVPPQFDALSRSTDLVTVGIGANNNRLYARIATVCRRSTHGCPLYDQRARLGSYVDELRPALGATLADVKRLAPHARVLLIGYPKLFPATGQLRPAPPDAPAGPGDVPRHQPADARPDARRGRGRRCRVRGLLPPRPTATTSARGTRGCRDGWATSGAVRPCIRCLPGRSALARTLVEGAATAAAAGER